MPARPTWPSTPTERTDRSIVVDLVRRVGAERLRWSIVDLQRKMREDARYRIAHPGQLARHVRALAPLTVVPVAQPLAAFMSAGQEAEVETEAQCNTGRAHHVYVLTERLPEHAATPPSWTEPARVYIALWVAIEAHGSDAVDTNAVTRVCATIDALAVEGTAQMTSRLAALAARSVPLVKRLGARPTMDSESRQPHARSDLRYGEGSTGRKATTGDAAPLRRLSRWRLWTPLGGRPDDPRFDNWVAIVRAMEDGDAVPQRVGHATVHDVVAELVDIAISRTPSPYRPQGRSVTVEDIVAARGDDARARELGALLAARGTTVGRALGDATKTRIAGRERVLRQIVKVGSVPGGRTYYDLPSRSGFEARRLVVPFETVRAALRPEVFDELAHEYKAALRLGREAGTMEHQKVAAGALTAIAAVRSLYVHDEVERLERLSRALEDKRHLLGEQAVKTLNRHADTIGKTRHYLGMDACEARAEAHERVAAVGVDLDKVLRAERPLLTGDELLEWIPRDQRNGRTGPELLADATLLTRFANTEHTRRSDSDPRRAAPTAVDRVEALVYLAEKYAGRTLALLQSGAAVLGRGLRDPQLPRLLIESDDDRLWARGLAALVLLGDGSAEEIALAALREPVAPAPMREKRPTTGRIVHALQALAVLRRCEPDSWPEAVRSSREPEIVHCVRQLLGASRSARWLL